MERREKESARKRKEKLARATLDRLRKRRFLRAWDPEYLPPAAVEDSRENFRQTVKALVELGPNPSSRGVLRILKQCIERFNELNERYDGFIETVEREEICDEFREIVHAAGLRGERYDNLADRWRDW